MKQISTPKFVRISIDFSLKLNKLDTSHNKRVNGRVYKYAKTGIVSKEMNQNKYLKFLSSRFSKFSSHLILSLNLSELLIIVGSHNFDIDYRKAVFLILPLWHAKKD